jgi:hypothetical protein
VRRPLAAIPKPDAPTKEKLMLTRSPKLVCALTLTLAASAAACQQMGPGDGEVAASTEAISVAGATYSSLRDIENIFPIPNPSATINVGTLDGYSGTFTGLVSQTHYEINPITHKPYPVTVPPTVAFHAVRAVLTFSATSRGTQPFSVTVNGATTSAQAGATTISVDVARTTDVSWSLRLGTTVVSDRLFISRQGVLGAGVFTLSALPISLLYEPPQTGAGLSSTSILTSQTVGTSITAGQSQENSTSKPKFVGVSAFIEKLQGVKGLLSLYGLASPLLNGVIDRAVGALGTWSQTTVDGTSTSTENTLQLSSTSSLSYSTNAGLGPGRGDRVIYLHNAQVAWVMLDGEISLSLIGYGSRAAYTVEQLRLDRTAIDAGTPVAQTVSQLDRDTLTALLNLDPFVGASALRGAALVAPRYQAQGEEEGDGPESFTLEHTETSTDKQTSSTFHAVTSEYKGGWLEALGLGPESGSTKVSTTVSSSQSTSVSTTVRASLQIASTFGSPYKLDVYYDTVFSTFAVRHPVISVVVGGGGVLTMAN